MDSDDFEVRIADFGLGLFKPNDDIAFRMCGTPGSIAPEILNNNGYSYKSDIFSLGILMYALLTGKHLFEGNDTNEIMWEN